MSYNPFLNKPLNYIPTDSDMEWFNAWDDKRNLHCDAWAELDRIHNLRVKRQQARYFRNPDIAYRLKWFKLNKQAELDIIARRIAQEKAIKKGLATKRRNVREAKKRQAAMAAAFRAEALAKAIATMKSEEKPRIRVKAIYVPYYLPEEIWTPERQAMEWHI